MKKTTKTAMFIFLLFFLTLPSPAHAENGTVVGVPDDYAIIGGSGTGGGGAAGQAPQTPPQTPPPVQEPEKKTEPGKTKGTKGTGNRKKEEEIKEDVPAGETVSENSISENEIPTDGTVSENTVPAVYGTTVSGNTAEKKGQEPAPKKDKPEKQQEQEPAEKQESKHIAGTITLSYLTVMVLAAAVWAGMYAPILYYRDEEGIYKILCPLFIHRGRDGYLVKVPKMFNRHTNFRLRFKPRFVNRHQGEVLEVHINDGVQQSVVSESVILNRE